MNEPPIFRIFYSWQSDSPSATNRNLIEEALKRAAKAIRNDDSIEVVPVVDRDTAGVPGSPNIATTIFDKIDQTDIFIGDVTIVGIIPDEDAQKDGRPSPNPNILFELGYAFKTLGEDNVILVMNTAYGNPENLPFDLRMRRVIPYKLQKGQAPAEERKKLQDIFEAALRHTILSRSTPKLVAPTQSPFSSLQNAVNNNDTDQEYLADLYMQDLTERLVRTAPQYSESVPRDEELLQTLDQSLDVVLEFSNICELVVRRGSIDTATALYKGFEYILLQYNVPVGFSGSYQDTDFDYYKFLGHELFVTLFSFLVKSKRWSIISTLLEDRIYVKNARLGNSIVEKLVSFDYVSQNVQLLDIRKKRVNLNSTASLHASLLNERHSQGELGHKVPMSWFVEGDFFLFLRGEVQQEPATPYIIWLPWSVLYLNDKPRFLIEAEQKKYAQQLLKPLAVPDLPTLRERMTIGVSKLGNLYSNIAPFWVLRRSSSFRGDDIAKY